MIEVVVNGNVFRVRCLLAELETGESMELVAPVIGGMSYTPPIMVESTPTPTLTVEPKPRKTRKPRTPKAKPVEATPVETPVVESVAETPVVESVAETPVSDAAIAAEAATPVARKRGGKRRSSRHVSVPLYECQATAIYPKKDGSGEFPVAIWKQGVHSKSQIKWYLLLFITKDLTTAYHNDGGFYADPAKLSNITIIG